MKRLRYYDILLALFVAILLISNLGATKLIAFDWLYLDGGVVLFPLIYVLAGVLTEVYGFKYARRAIWTGFGVMLLAIFAFTVVRFMPAAPEYEHQAAYEAVLGFLPQIVIASLVAYLVGEFVNSYVLAKLKLKTKGKKLWLRLVGSTFIGQGLDTVIFCLIAFGGIISGAEMISYIMVGWGLKVAAEIILLPLTYRVVVFLKKREGLDAYDKKTDFNPLRVSVD